MVTDEALNFESLKTELITLCNEVSKFIRSQIEEVIPSQIEAKEANSLVSYVDREAERMIVSRLKVLTPSAGFITEEGTIGQSESKITWIIDPLDGTTNFLQKIPHFSISIALRIDELTQLGIVYEIMHDIAYTAIAGKGAWQNDQKISVNKNTQLKDSIVVTGFPYDRKYDLEANLEMLKYCILNCRGIRRLGSAALDLAYVASGKIDLYYEHTLNIWDLAAGALLVTEAGGEVSDYNGEKSFLQKGSIIAGYSPIHLHFKEKLSHLY